MISSPSIIRTIRQRVSRMFSCSAGESTESRSAKRSCSGEGAWSISARPADVITTVTSRRSFVLRSRATSWRAASRSMMPVMVAWLSATSLASSLGVILPRTPTVRRQTSCGPVSPKVCARWRLWRSIARVMRRSERRMSSLTSGAVLVAVVDMVPAEGSLCAP